MRMLLVGLFAAALACLGCGRLHYVPLAADAGLDAMDAALAVDADNDAGNDPDAGTDAATDAGSATDAGNDVGSDAGSDTGSDTGSDAFDPCSLCDTNATCTATVCTCNTGFTGDGRTCMPLVLGFTALEAYVKASNTGGSDLFGASTVLSADGNTLAVGALRESGSGTGINPPSNESSTSSGAAYIYRRAGALWVFEAYIKASNTGRGDSFSSIALSADGNTLAVGAGGEDGSGTGINPPSDEGALGSGAAYIYRRTGAAVWAFEAYIKASNATNDDGFGRSLALSADGNTLAVTAGGEDGSGMGVNPPSDEGSLSSGAAYIYRRAGAVWAFEAYIKASNAGSGDAFSAIALSADGDTLAVGAAGEDGSGTGVNPPSDEGSVDSGAAYLYRRSGAVWAFEAYIKASNTGSGDAFGTAIALSGDGNTLAVGALREGGAGMGINPPSDDASMDSGATYVYRRSGAVWAFEAYIKASNTGSGDNFGGSLALSADGNALAVGAGAEAGSGTGINPPSDDGTPSSGAAYIYRRAGAVWAFAFYIKASNTGVGDGFGESVALSADGNTLAVGAYGEGGSGMGINPPSDEAATRSGAVYVYR